MILQFHQVTNAINAVVLSTDGGGTNIGEAILLSREEVFRTRRGDRINVPNIAIIITGTSRKCNLTKGSVLK